MLTFGRLKPACTNAMLKRGNEFVKPVGSLSYPFHRDPSITGDFSLRVSARKRRVRLLAGATIVVNGPHRTLTLISGETADGPLSSPDDTQSIELEFSIRSCLAYLPVDGRRSASRRNAVAILRSLACSKSRFPIYPNTIRL